jgi:hypothetical protein
MIRSYQVVSDGYSHGEFFYFIICCCLLGLSLNFEMSIGWAFFLLLQWRRCGIFIWILTYVLFIAENFRGRYCKCEMPYNPDDLMVQCEGCSDW